MPTIKSSIVAGSKIISDEWKSYTDIEKCGYEHQTVKHCEKFVDPTTGACTNRVEEMWNLAKFENKKRWGTHRTLLDSYLCEFIWQKTKTQTIKDCLMKYWMTSVLLIHQFKLNFSCLKGGELEKSQKRLKIFDERWLPSLMLNLRQNLAQSKYTNRIKCTLIY